MSSLRPLLKRLTEDHAGLTQAEASAALREILEDEAGDIEIASLLTAIASRGASVDELTGFVETMRARMRMAPLNEDERADLVDTCGTGGDGRGTFNISTGAALVAAAAGVKVAKHGNRGLTSRCGSADVLEALGVPIELEPEVSVQCLRETGFMFLYAPAMHPAMKRVQPVRKALGFRTIFNLAGPLTNPAGAKGQVVGVYDAAAVGTVAGSLARLGARHAFVVHGQDGLDELTLKNANDIAEVQGNTVRIFRMHARDAGLEEAPLEALAGGDARENAAILERILNGKSGPQRDVVLLNAAAALMIAGLARDFPEGIHRAAEAIDQGAGAELLARLRAFAGRARQPQSHQAPPGGSG